jgi:hypothetical protein
MFIVIQSYPDEKILFASSSKMDAYKFFDLQVEHGKGWFELWQEGQEIPLQTGGEQFFAPYHSPTWANQRTTTHTTGSNAKTSKYHFWSKNKQNLILTTWE